MKTKAELERLNNEQDIIAFFSEHHKQEIELAKLKMLHAYHDLIDGINKIYERQTKGMAKEQINAYIEECEDSEDEDGPWSVALDSLINNITEEQKFSMDIELEDYGVEITYMTHFFYISWKGMISATKPKLSEMEGGFEVELTSDAHFLVDLITALIYEHKSEE